MNKSVKELRRLAEFFSYSLEQDFFLKQFVENQIGKFPLSHLQKLLDQYHLFRSHPVNHLSPQRRFISTKHTEGEQKSIVDEQFRDASRLPLHGEQPVIPMHIFSEQGVSKAMLPQMNMGNARMMPEEENPRTRCGRLITGEADLPAWGKTVQPVGQPPRGEMELIQYPVLQHQRHPSIGN